MRHGGPFEDDVLVAKLLLGDDHFYRYGSEVLVG